MDVFVARQPIFDKDKNVYAYELLFRAGLKNAFSENMDGDKATSQVISSSFMSIGVEELVADKRIFINFTGNLLLDKTAELLPKEVLTVEVLENVDPTSDIVDAVKSLKEKGYVVALDDFIAKDLNHPLIPYTDIIKVDFMDTTPEERKKIVDLLKGHKIKFLAEKVETNEEFQDALKWGYSYFQGYFFQKPEVVQGKEITGNKLNYFRMIAKVNDKNFIIDEITDIIKQDVSLTYKLLKFLNSPFFGFRREINSIKLAVTLLGIQQTRKWASLMAMSALADDKPAELLYTSVIRGNFCETLGDSINMSDKKSELFLTGMLSVVDALMDKPMEEVVKDLPINIEVKNALVGEDNLYRKVFELVECYEKGSWEIMEEKSEKLKLDINNIPEIYKKSVSTAESMMQNMKG